MKTEISNTSQVEFNLHDSLSNLIVVNHIHPDGSKELIGRIYQHYSEEEGCITYTGYSKEGEEISPPTTDWITAEAAFLKYARQHAERSQAERMEIIYTEQAEREKQINDIRKGKGRKEKTIAITI